METISIQKEVVLIDLILGQFSRFEGLIDKIPTTIKPIFIHLRSTNLTIRVNFLTFYLEQKNYSTDPENSNVRAISVTFYFVKMDVLAPMSKSDIINQYHTPISAQKRTIRRSLSSSPFILLGNIFSVYSKLYKNRLFPIFSSSFHTIFCCFISRFLSLPIKTHFCLKNV